jgi:hypothetical protein
VYSCFPLYISLHEKAKGCRWLRLKISAGFETRIQNPDLHKRMFVRFVSVTYSYLCDIPFLPYPLTHTHTHTHTHPRPLTHSHTNTHVFSLFKSTIIFLLCILSWYIAERTFSSSFLYFVFVQEYRAAFPPYLLCQFTRLFISIQFRISLLLILNLSVPASIHCSSTV